MGHGTPLDPRGERLRAGRAAYARCRHLLDAPDRRVWGLTGKTVSQRDAATRAPRQARQPAQARAAQAARQRPAAPRAEGVGAVIESALRAAGLMR